MGKCNYPHFNLAFKWNLLSPWWALTVPLGGSANTWDEESHVQRCPDNTRQKLNQDFQKYIENLSLSDIVPVLLSSAGRVLWGKLWGLWWNLPWDSYTPQNTSMRPLIWGLRLLPQSLVLFSHCQHCFFIAFIVPLDVFKLKNSLGKAGDSWAALCHALPAKLLLTGTQCIAPQNC